MVPYTRTFEKISRMWSRVERAFIAPTQTQGWDVPPLSSLRSDRRAVQYSAHTNDGYLVPNLDQAGSLPILQCVSIGKWRAVMRAQVPTGNGFLPNEPVAAHDHRTVPCSLIDKHILRRNTTAGFVIVLSV
jgi:hypothetical protein